MNILKYIKKSIVFVLVVFGLSWAFQSPSYAAGLEGNWKLTTLGTSPVPKELEITVKFNPAENKIEGRAACNAYFGFYESTEDAIKLKTPVISTLAFCGEEPAQYLSAINSPKSYKVSDQELTITTSYSRAEVLKFVKVQ